MFFCFVAISGRVFASNIAQGRVTSDQALTMGMAASLSVDDNSADQAVVRSNTKNESKYVGIVTTKSDNQLTLTNVNSNVVVTTSGRAKALVTDINGVVKKGDSLSISPLNGVLMRAESLAGIIFAIALEDFEGKTPSSHQVQLEGGSNKSIQVYTVEVEVSSNPGSTQDQSQSSSFLGVLGKSITGKQVSDLQVAIAATIFIIILVVEGSLIYGSVHSTITALGRNPMSKDTVYRQLLQVILVVMAVLAFGMATIYATLKI